MFETLSGSHLSIGNTEHEQHGRFSLSPEHFLSPLIWVKFLLKYPLSWLSRHDNLAASEPQVGIAKQRLSVSGERERYAQPLFGYSLNTSPVKVASNQGFLIAVSWLGSAN